MIYISRSRSSSRDDSGNSLSRSYDIRRARTLISHLLMFFFQAEDGIRDVAVTGVQTCALPIFLANYTFSKSLSNAPDFRSPMFEAAIPQNDGNLAAEKGLACDIRHRFALSAVYSLPGFSGSRLLRAFSHNWVLSTVYQVQTGFPFTISVLGDTANAGTVLGENPIRANLTGQPIFGPGTHTAAEWFNPKAFSTPPAFTFGDVGRNTVIGPGLQTIDLALAREFSLVERMKFQFRAEFFNALNQDRKSTRLNSSHGYISYAVFCLKKKK